MKIFEELKQRRFAQFVAAYGAVGWGVVEVVDQLVDRELLTELWYRLVLVAFLAGIPAALIISWYHGGKGDQKAPVREMVMLTTIGLIAVLSGAWVVRTYEPSDPASVARRLRASATEQLPETEDPRRIAVLYFDARSPDEDVPFLAAGLTETLIDELSKVDALDVVSRHGVEQFRGRPTPADSVGRTLHVGTIVDGTVAVSEGQIRVNVEFLNGNTGEQFGRTLVQRPKTELFGLQDDLAHEVAVFLRGRVGEELEVIERQAGAENVEAWQLLQRGRAAIDQADDLSDAGDEEAAQARLTAADSLLAAAEQAAPEWVDPTVLRGQIAFTRSRWRGGTEQVEASRWIDVGLEHARAALELAPDDPDALELRGSLRYWRYLLDLESDPRAAQQLLDDAEADLRRSVSLNPDQAGAWAMLGHLINNKGDVAGAKLAAQRAYQADAYMRDADVILWRLYTGSYDLGDRPEAEHWCAELGRRFPDDHRYVECQLWQMTMDGAEPDVEKAWQLASTYEELAPAGEGELNVRWSRMAVAAILARAGLADSARAVADRNKGNPSLDPTRDLAYVEAFVRTLVGDQDAAVRLLTEFVAAVGAERSDIDFWWFSGLQGNPAYEALLAATTS